MCVKNRDCSLNSESITTPMCPSTITVVIIFMHTQPCSEGKIELNAIEYFNMLKILSSNNISEMNWITKFLEVRENSYFPTLDIHIHKSNAERWGASDRFFNVFKTFQTFLRFSLNPPIIEPFFLTFLLLTLTSQ